MQETQNKIKSNHRICFSCLLSGQMLLWFWCKYPNNFHGKWMQGSQRYEWSVVLSGIFDFKELVQSSGVGQVHGQTHVCVDFWTWDLWGHQGRLSRSWAMQLEGRQWGLFCLSGSPAFRGKTFRMKPFRTQKWLWTWAEIFRVNEPASKVAV